MTLITTSSAHYEKSQLTQLSTKQIPFKLKLIIGVVTSLLSVSALQAQAGATINFGEDKSVTVGLGLRTSFSSTEDAAPNKSARSQDFNVDSTRLYLDASLNKYIKGTLNIEGNVGGAKTGESVQVFDAIARFEFMPEFNVWAGRMLVPNDRANLDGPYYLSSYLYPGLVAQYPGQIAGRDTGVTIWGKLMDAHLTYATGAYEGHNNVAKASSENDNLMYAARVQYDFWDANPIPAYYTASTLYGKDILAVGLVANYQKNGVGSAAQKGDYLGYNMDVLMEKILDIGVLDLEGAIYRFDTDGISDVAGGFGGASATANVGGIKAGKAYLASANFLFPQVIGWGKFQPFVRYLKFNADATTGDGINSLNVASSDTKQYDVGVNYIIEGHNARISAEYSKTDPNNAASADTYFVGLQLQF